MSDRTSRMDMKSAKGRKGKSTSSMAGIAASTQAEMFVSCCASRPSSGAFPSRSVLHFVLLIRPNLDFSIRLWHELEVYEVKAKALDFPWDGIAPQICIFPSPLAVMNGFRWHGT